MDWKDIALHTAPSLVVGALMGFMGAFGLHHWPNLIPASMVVGSAIATLMFSWLWTEREKVQHGGHLGGKQSWLEAVVPLIAGPVAYGSSVIAFLSGPFERRSMEPKLTKQSEAILTRLKQDVEKRLLTPEQFEFLRKAMLLQESVGMFGSFIVWLAGLVAAGVALVSYWPDGGAK